jgi:hypothetical protein
MSATEVYCWLMPFGQKIDFSKRISSAGYQAFLEYKKITINVVDRTEQGQIYI